ncbi:hypothetical protein tinsulaeT_03950 [Thalassotalea insulae]|uniref:DUF4097 domain-containing protein n=1 Tax=Thalassotalea insulae TaxID=2056778 RepID=A0ABQ6GM25_9GAMM|nr:DUF4097 family beta strand repeat-containing protein [Thalassotalea insulae]GLX77055.1 hypothetical protein tinsulaeT_03950 [Thalassotalea insulae]
MYKKKILFLSVLLFNASAFADVRDEIVKTFEVSEQAEFRLENINGDVEVNGWDKNEIKVQAILIADDQDDLARITVDIDESSRGVSVETRYKKSSQWRDHNSGSVDYVIYLPKAAKLADIELVNGSLTVEDVQGEAKFKLVNGSIAAQGLMNDSEISSVNGSIDVSYSAASPQLNDIRIDTVNGQVELNLPENIGADVDIETMHGSIRNDFGLSVDKGKFVGRNLHGTIGSGDVNISIESVNGGVRLLKR